MNMPFVPSRTTVRLADLRDPDDRRAIERFVRAHPQGTPFHLPAWLQAVEQGTANRAVVLVAENPSNQNFVIPANAGIHLQVVPLTQGQEMDPRLRGDDEKHGAGDSGSSIVGLLPLNEIHSPIFGRLLASTGFAVDGGMLLSEGEDGTALLAAAERLALSHSCPTIELRGGPASDAREGWALRTQSHCGFVTPLAADDEAQLTAVPRKQRAEVRKSLANDFQIEVGTSPELRAEHYAVYAESVRNLGTPVFPRALFDAVLNGFGDDVDILTVRHEGRAVASVLSLYWRGAVMPYWGGGTWDARRLRANDRMYYELMLHARRRGCDRFDFGRSKTDSGAYHFKRNWGFTPEPLSYAVWTAPGAEKRDADPTSAKHKAQIALWQRLPLPIANTIGPWIARGLG